MYSVSGIPHVQFAGTNPVVGGGTDMYPYYLSEYEQIVGEDAPLSIGVTMNVNEAGLLEIEADIDLSANITTNNNKLQFMITNYYSDSYSCSVQRYAEYDFALNSAGQSETFTQTFDIDGQWDLASVKGIVLVQTFSGDHKIHNAGIAGMAPNAIITGLVTDVTTGNPIGNAEITAGSFVEFTDASGSYVLNVIAGPYDVTASAEGYNTSTVSLTAIEDDIVEANFIMNEMMLAPSNLLANVDGGSVTLNWSSPSLPVLHIAILTDNYPAETSWDIVDESGTIIESVSGGSLSSGATLYEWDIELTAGAYTWTIYDAYGDGICCAYGEGAYTLYLNDTEFANGGEFGSSESVSFHTDDVLSRDMIGYNVFQDYMLLNENPITELTYTVNGLMNGTYDFAVTAVYDSGESEAVAITVEVTDASVEMELTHLEGWDMVGLPAIVEDANYLSIFPSALENTLFSYGPEGMVLESELTSGNGYWLRFSDANPATLFGFPFDNISIDLLGGWNLIAGVSMSVPVANISDNDGVIIPNTIYGFNEGGYFNAETFDPGHGYWMRTLGAGQIIISSTLLRDNDNTFENQLVDNNSITVTSNETSKTLYFGVEMDENDALSYSLPPCPPMGFDVRFSNNMSFVHNSGELKIMSEYPVIIDMNITDGSTWILENSISREQIEVSESQEINLNDTEGWTIRRDDNSMIASSFGLNQNYPNPFNPTTEIAYSIQEAGFVNLSVYDISGRLVTTLVNEHRENGYYTVQFNASDLSSGVYLYTIESTGLTLTKKLMLVK
jgi:hypothetical protein